MHFSREGYHHRNPDTHLLDKFYVVTMISNPVRFKSRYVLYDHFAKHMAASGVKLVTVEVAFGDRKHQITDHGDPTHIRLQTHDEIWHKENALNIAISQLPRDWEYVAWIDADIQFMRPDWAIETVHQLQHHHFVQLWETAADMGPTGQQLQTFGSFASSYVKRQPIPVSDGGKYYPSLMWHPGFAWACRREAWDAVGGLIDFAILGAADTHMAFGLINQVEKSLPEGLHPNYSQGVLSWQENAERIIRRDLGYVPGHIVHFWHGKKKDRKYADRWKILTTNKFDPLRDLRRDWSNLGLYQLTERSRQLRDDLRAYFRARNEDSIDLE